MTVPVPGPIPLSGRGHLPLRGVPVTHWRNLAACLGIPTAIFFPERSVDERHAVAICHGCPVQAECLLDAYATDDVWHGVRGGLRAHERRKLAGDIRSAQPRQSPFELVHGTAAGYAWERRQGLETCQACREAHAARQADNKAARRAVAA